MKELLKKQSALFWIAAVFLGVILLMALVPQLFTHYDPIEQNMNFFKSRPHYTGLEPTIWEEMYFPEWYTVQDWIWRLVFSPC